jgi:ABC-type multidrug transport system fused ATPase/permease subunit
VLLVSAKIVIRRLQPIAQQLSDAHGIHLASVEENLRTLVLLKAFSRESAESRKILEQNQAIVSLERKHLLISNLTGPAIQVLGAMLLITVLWLSSERLAQGALATGQLVTLLLYGLLIFRPASQMASALGNLQSTRGASDRLLTALSVPTEDFQHGQMSAPAMPGNIRFDNVTFAYPGQSRLLQHFDLAITSGETVAITGANGSGKSTLVNLLMRFATPQHGRILMDGIDIKTLNLNTLRQQIALVPQQVTLLNDTLRNNITFGLPQADDRRVEVAARTAQAWDFIQALPSGLDSRIGPDGVGLSGGQRQRIALARALLSGRPVLVLDEATSMFDVDAECAFLREVREKLQDRTILLITHRAKSLEVATRVVQLGAAQDG